MAEHDAHSLVRESATRALSMVDAPDKISIYKRIVQQEKAYNVLGEALAQLFQESPDDALKLSGNFEKTTQPTSHPK